MDNVEFEILQRKIRSYQTNLNALQSRYKAQTGRYLSINDEIKAAKFCSNCIFHKDIEDKTICSNANSEYYNIFVTDGCIEHIIINEKE